MATDLQTSFIPKQSAPLPPLERRRQPINFLMIIAVLIFIAGIAASVGVFVYQIYLTKTNDNLASELAKLKPDRAQIDVLKKFNQRVNISNQLLSGHTTMAPIFTMLGDSTLQNVRFKGMSISTSMDTPRVVTIALSGEAKNYEAIALQSDSFTSSGFIKNAVFSGLQFDSQTRNINFNVSAVVDPSLLSYSKNLQMTAGTSGAPAGEVPVVPTTPSASTTPPNTAS
jgi:hypothetical protein